MKSFIVILVCLNIFFGSFMPAAEAGEKKIEVCALVPWLPGEWEGSREITGPRDVLVPLTAQFKIAEDGRFSADIQQRNAQFTSGVAAVNEMTENSVTVTFLASKWALRLIKQDVLEAKFTSYSGGGAFNNYVLLKKKKSFAC